ncbi:GM25473 [Drosophila sechellia]|uniref:GM25473 n=1 Tax=Drosophila sechellia TaxID=7238 RepID=B4HHR9_DROSE|nr:GM25473 [Drosophila sechellia]
MSAAGWLDMNAALQNLDSPPESVKKVRTKRRSSYAGRSSSAAGVHGRGSIGTISSGIIKSFRERFLSSSSGDSGKYRKLRQRDAESGRMASASSSSGEDEDPSSSSSVEDLFANEAERRNWHRKTSEKRRRNARKKHELSHGKL